MYKIGIREENGIAEQEVIQFGQNWSGVWMTGDGAGRGGGGKYVGRVLWCMICCVNKIHMLKPGKRMGVYED